MFDSRTLNVDDIILLAYNHKGKTVPPHRVVRITYVDDQEFAYFIEKVLVKLPQGDKFLDPKHARSHGVAVRSGRRIQHADFTVNMAEKTRRLSSVDEV